MSVTFLSTRLAKPVMTNGVCSAVPRSVPGTGRAAAPRPALVPGDIASPAPHGHRAFAPPTETQPSGPGWSPAS